VTLKDLRSGTVTPRWRNQALAWFLSRLQLAQAEGQGIQTIRSTMKAARCPPPIFNATDVSVTCILRAHPRFESAHRRKSPPKAKPKGKAKLRARPAAKIRKKK
jgi:ATP-dependent DNA helicase RecG